MAQAPKVSNADATATPADISELFEAHAGRLLGIPEDTPQPDDEQEDAPDADAEVDATEPELEQDADADVEAASDELEESEPQEDQDPDQDEQPELHTIKVDGKEIQVTLEEMKAGHQRHRDYTQKTQAVREREKVLAENEAQVSATRTNLIALLEKADIAMQAMAPEVEPDWAEMAESMTAEDVLAAQKEYRGFTQRRKIIQDRLEAERQAEFAAAQKAAESARATESQRLHDAMPSWKDETKRDADQKAIVAYALSLGFTKEALKTVADHRLILLLDKARRYDALKGKSRQPAAKGKQGVRTAVPGVSTPPRNKSTANAKAREAARARLAKSGSAKDAAALFELSM